MTDKSRLYYEAHINFPHPTEAEAKIVRDVCAEMPSWRMATFEMHKDRQPTGFCTGRSEYRSLIEQEVLSVADKLRESGIEILRWKIEDTLLDSNRGDTLNDLRSRLAGSRRP